MVNIMNILQIIVVKSKYMNPIIFNYIEVKRLGVIYIIRINIFIKIELNLLTGF